ncbi:VPDSG-CTERM sorting domain-containing protein [Pelagicoccus sp. SDUM812005]|uniref:VPDSG-CTERM sorting domain-containing protein n=1 Tax=Pelagicoccus sp. SDUM812005 TaxID=3041257 RepID=UPI00280E1E0C|nr:VPDSG-CTERM sorting domain-containing protein [Pelagicoccus sp. SDUM812005]MDQ8183085.1 VPDSG-CTERM sorting domain-containing protein [Pelagicoccus sp. SDUM812005]
MKSKYLSIVSVLALSTLCGTSAHAVMYGGIEFPGGSISFADSVVSYDPSFGGGNVPTDPNFMDPDEALGIPDYVSPIGSVSLGAGGRIVLEFVDNFLTGSSLDGVADGIFDLHIFEIGPDVEDTAVAISKDGVAWTEIGSVFGSTSSIDIDAFGFKVSDQFRFVRLTDDINEGGTTGSTVGADIDAVGAISTVINTNPGGNTVPDAGSTAAILMLSLAGLAVLKRRIG